MKRRIAVHEVLVEGRESRVESRETKHSSPCIIEITDGIVTDCYAMIEEEPQTEWIGGTVVLRKNNQGKIQAFKNNRLLC